MQSMLITFRAGTGIETVEVRWGIWFEKGSAVFIDWERNEHSVPLINLISIQKGSN